MLTQARQWLREALCGMNDGHSYFPSRYWAGYMTCEYCRRRKRLEG